MIDRAVFISFSQRLHISRLRPENKEERTGMKKGQIEICPRKWFRKNSRNYRLSATRLATSSGTQLFQTSGFSLRKRIAASSGFL